MPQAKKKHRSNPAWIKRHVTDPFVQRSVQEGFRSRAAYKLFERLPGRKKPVLPPPPPPAD